MKHVSALEGEEKWEMEERILIADDGKMIYSVLARRLAQEGYLCAMASNGREALGYFYENHFPLIISDIRMPEMNGLELLKNVKAVIYDSSNVFQMT